LADWLIPTIPSVGGGARVDARTLAALLGSMACANQDPVDAETWVSPSGQFRLGGVRGAWGKPEARYIGHAAREAARRARLGAIAARLAELDAAFAGHESAAAALAARRDAAQSEYARAPDDDGLLRWHAEHNAAEQQRREAQTRLGEAEAKLAQADHALARARDALELDARALNLPATVSDLEVIERALGDYRVAVTEFGNALRQHRAALAELADQMLREARAAQALTSAGDDHREKQKLWANGSMNCSARSRPPSAQSNSTCAR
jgi:tetratricopeptide (TPR) repeat protein